MMMSTQTTAQPEKAPEVNTTGDAVKEALTEMGVEAPTVRDPIQRSIKPIPPPVEKPKEPAVEAKPKTGEKAPVVSDEDTWTPSAADFEIIKKDPLLLKVYNSMNRGFTMKAEGVANQRKALEADADLIQKIRTNPRAAIEALASVANLPVQFKEPEKDAPNPLQEAEAELAKVLTPEGAAALRPALVKLIEAVTGEKIRPLSETVEQSQRESVASSLASAVKSFGASKVEEGLDWNPEISAEMTKLVGVVVPGKGMTVSDYLDIIYDRVIAVRQRGESRRQTLERLRAATHKQEPTHGARPAVGTDTGEITDDMDDKTATSVATAAALKEMGLR